MLDILCNHVVRMEAKSEMDENGNGKWDYMHMRTANEMENM